MRKQLLCLEEENMKKWVLGLSILAGLCISTQVLADESSKMYRLYNPNSGEHFYTASNAEQKKLIQLGWYNEGIGWYAPREGIPVYRLYNPNNGDHHYTMSAAEKNMLTNLGWHYEGIGWNSDTNKQVPLYRVYNPNNKGAGSHHYTTKVNESQKLIDLGWKNEGIGWYGVQSSIPVKDDKTKELIETFKGDYYTSTQTTPEFSIDDNYFIDHSTNKRYLIKTLTILQDIYPKLYIVWDVDAFSYEYGILPPGPQPFSFDLVKALGETNYSLQDSNWNLYSRR